MQRSGVDERHVCHHLFTGGFSDVQANAYYATAAVAWVQVEGIVNGKSGNVFDPNGGATRAQTATILYRYLTNPNQNNQGNQGNRGNEENQPEESKQIEITTGQGNVIVFQLNDSPAASELYNQLPLAGPVENFGSNEKIFYITEKLDTSNTPLAKGPAGILAYYEPWGNVAIFYGECGGASGLYELGEVVLGASYISEVTGEIQVRAGKEEQICSIKLIKTI